MRAYDQPHKRGERSRGEILDFIEEFKRTHDGCSPTAPVIGRGCHLTTRTVTYHLKILEYEGMIVRYQDMWCSNIGLTGRRRYVADADRVAELEGKLARMREVLGE